MRYNFLVITMLCLSCNAFSQGCSDAGFCTIGHLKAMPETQAAQSITVGLTNGVGDEQVYVFTPYVQYDAQLNKHWSIQGKLTANYANGNLGTATGAGDIFLSSTYSPAVKGKWKQSFLLAVKLPLNGGNLSINRLSLPMQYQSSLGTVDAIAGYTISDQHWLFAAAWQQPLTGRNSNQFLPVYYNTAAAAKYPPGNDFNRKADVLARVNYNINTSAKLKLNVGLLGIYHVANDTYIDGNISNKPIAIAGSKGLTVNITGAATIDLSNKVAVAVLVGAPVLVRDIRPDGLTRSFTATPELIIKF